MAAPVHPYSDYGIALKTLRTARNWLGVILFSCVVAQMVGFLLMRFTRQPYISSHPVVHRTPASTSTAGPAEFPATLGFEPSGAGSVSGENLLAPNHGSLPQFRISQWTVQTRAGRLLNLRPQWDTTYYLAVPGTQLIGLLAAASQVVLIFLTLIIILIAQAPGVAHLTRSLIWAVVLLFMVLPWQYFFHGFPVPGVLYSWHELLHTLGLVFLLPPGHGIPSLRRMLIVARYIAWPALAMLVMLVAAERFRAGTRLAIGHPLQNLMRPSLGAGAAGSRTASSTPAVRAPESASRPGPKR